MTDALYSALENKQHHLLIKDRKVFNAAIALLDKAACDTIADIIAMATNKAIAEQAIDLIPHLHHHDDDDDSSSDDSSKKKKKKTPAKKTNGAKKAKAKQCKGKHQQTKERCGRKTTNASGYCYQHE